MRNQATRAALSAFLAAGCASFFSFASAQRIRSDRKVEILRDMLTMLLWIVPVPLPCPAMPSLRSVVF